MKKNKKRKIKFGMIIVLLLVLFVFGVILFFLLKIDDTVEPEQIEVIDSIDNFHYQLNDNKTEYFNVLFSSLKELLGSYDYDEEEYATLIGQLFLADFYDLDSKVMKSDVGGIQFVYEIYRDDFERGAMDSVYKYIESNIYGDRKQELPKIKSVEKVNLKQGTFIYNDMTDDSAYYLDMKITYDKDLGYPVSISLIIIHNDDKLEIAEMKTN